MLHGPPWSVSASLAGWSSQPRRAFSSPTGPLPSPPRGPPHALDQLWQEFTLRCLDSVLKSKDITLPTKVHIIKAMVFPVVMYGCESWTRKKVEHQRIDVFKLWCWRRLLRFPWTIRRSNQPIIKEINPEYSLEGLLLKLKFQYFGYLGKEPTQGKRL